MFSEFKGFDDELMNQLSQMGIEIIHDQGSQELGNFLPKAIYEMVKKNNQKSENKEE